MLILAIDTASVALSAALIEDGTIRAEVFANTGENHSLHLMPLIRQAYDLARAKPEITDLFVCTQGPGSFTGLRTGVSTIKGLAMATGKPVVGLSTLAALAANVGPVSTPVFPLLDARQDLVYAASYQISDNFYPEQIGSEQLIDIKSFLSTLQAGRKALFIGSGAINHAGMIKKALPEALIAPLEISQVRAGTVGFLGLQEYLNNGGADVLAFAPRYLRLSEAERKFQ